MHHKCLFLCRAGCYADTAALTIQRVNLHTEFVLLDFACAVCIQNCVGCGSVCCFLLCQQERTDCSVRANVGALVTLDTFCCIPCGNVNRNTAFFKCGGAKRNCAVLSACKYGYRQQVALQCVHGKHQLFYIFGKNLLDCFVIYILCILPACGNVNLCQTGKPCVNSGIVHVDNLFALLAVGFYDSRLHVCNCVINGDDVCQLEECGLQNCVCLVTQTDFLTNLDCINGVEVDVVVCDGSLYLRRQVMIQLIGCPCAVQQEGAAGLDFGNDIIFFHVALVMTSNEVCVLCYQIAGADGLVAETQVRTCDTAGFLCVIFKISLCVFICVVTDDFDGVFVCANRTVGAKTPEFAGYGACVSQIGLCANLDGAVGNIINDTNGEVVFLCALHVVKYCDNLCRSHILGGQTVSACQNLCGSACFDQCGTNIAVKRLAQCAGFLCSVQNGQNLYCFGQSCCEVCQREGSVQVNLQETNLFALCSQAFHNLLRNACYGAHRYDNMLCVSCAEVVEQLVISACDFVDFVHVFLYDFRQSGVEGCACLSVLEEYVGVLYGGALYGVFGIQCILSELLQCLLIHQLFQILIVHYFDFLQLMRGTETIEEVDEGNAALDCGKVCHTCQVHNLLYGCGGKHCTANLTAGHNVGVIAEDGEGMCTNGSGCNVEYAGLQLPCDSVHRGNHQQQPLRCGIGCCQCACLQSAVHCACGTCFGFQLQQTHGLTEDILFAVCSPAVYVLRHRGGGSDGVNRCDLCKGIGNVCRSFITIHGFHHFCVHGVDSFHINNKG